MYCDLIFVRARLILNFLLERTRHISRCFSDHTRLVNILSLAVRCKLMMKSQKMLLRIILAHSFVCIWIMAFDKVFNEAIAGAYIERHFTYSKKRTRVCGVKVAWSLKDSS